MRTFETGATRDTDQGKNCYRGFLSPAAIRRFGDYMHAHRVQADGTLRDAGNWKKGIPKEEYIESGWRHWLDIVEAFENGVVDEEALCAMWFNIQGLLHEHLKDKAEVKANPMMQYAWHPEKNDYVLTPCDEGY